jgi:hypothetical protein
MAAIPRGFLLGELDVSFVSVIGRRHQPNCNGG